MAFDKREGPVKPQNTMATSVTELSGRTVSYGYDSIYRLTSETIRRRSEQRERRGELRL